MQRLILLVPFLLLACAEEVSDSRPGSVLVQDTLEDEPGIEEELTTSEVDLNAWEEDLFLPFEKPVPTSFLHQCDDEFGDVVVECLNTAVRGMQVPIDDWASAAGVSEEEILEGSGFGGDWANAPDTPAGEHLHRSQGLLSVPQPCRVFVVPAETGHRNLTLAYWVGTF